jgi:hypothetical protein
MQVMDAMLASCRLIPFVATVLMTVAGGAIAADTPAVPLPAAGIGGMTAVEGNPATPDVEAQLQEIERTKRLMRALGEMHGGNAAPRPGTPAAAAGASAPAVPQPGVKADAASPASALGLPALPDGAAAEIRGLVNSAGEVARAVGVSGDKPAATAERGSPLQEESRSRTRASDNDLEVRAMFDSLLDEVLPWAIGFVLLFGLAYTGFSWMSGRSARGPHAGGRRSRRSSSRGSREGSRLPGEPAGGSSREGAGEGSRRRRHRQR